MLKALKFTLLVLFFAILPLFTVQAGEIRVQYGIGVGEPAWGNVKFLEAGFQDYIVGPWVYTLSGGFWSDIRGGYATSPFVSATSGLKVEYGPLMATSGWGLGAIAFPDAALSTYWQFCNDSAAGIRSKEGHSVALFYKHMSNAGIKLPNQGRDFFGIRVGINF